MINLLQIVIAITALFFIMLGIKQFLKGKAKEEFCAICLAVSINWIILLILYWLGLFNDKTILAVLMGQSSLGIFYLAEKNVKENLKIFRLPFLLTLIMIVYSVLEGFSYSTNVIYFIFILWILFIFIYAFNENGKFKKLTKKIIECCKKW